MQRDQIKWLVIGLAGALVPLVLMGIAAYSVYTRVRSIPIQSPEDRRTRSFEEARTRGIEKVDGPAEWHKRAEKFRAGQGRPNRLLNIYTEIKPYGDLPDKLYRDRDFDMVETDLRDQFIKIADPMAAVAYGNTVAQVSNLSYKYEPDDQRAIVERWTTERPDSHFAWIVRGFIATDYAWYWRGSGWGASVTDEGRKHFDSAIDEAREYFERAYKLDPGDPESSLGLMLVCMASGARRPELEKYFDRAVRVTPANVAVYRQKLEYLKPKWYGSWSAVDQFVKQIEAASAKQGHPLLLLVKLDAYRDMAQEREGYKDLMQREDVRHDILAMRQGVVQRWPDDLASRAELARAHVLRKQYKEALEQFEIIGNRFPAFGPYSIGEFHEARLTSHYSSWDRLDKASHAKLYEKWIAIDPDYAPTYDNIGAKQFADGEYDLAVGALSRAIELSPNEGHMYLELAYAYEKLGQYDVALRTVKKGQTLKATDKMKDEMARLESRLDAKPRPGKV